MKEHEEFSGYTVPACSKCPHYPGDEEAYRNAIAADFRLPCGQQNCWLELEEREHNNNSIVKRRKRPSAQNQ